MSEESDRLRLGGMALANGLLVHGPTSWAAAVVDDDGEVIVGSGPRPRLNGRLLERVPLARGVIRMVESMMVVPAARAGVPEARLAMEDRPVGVMVVSTMVASALLRRRIKNVVAQEAAVATVNLLPILLMLRLSPASRWHAVEHKSIAAYERAGSLGIATNVVDPKEHPRCGSNLVLPLMVSSAVGNIAARAVRGRRRRALVRAGALVAGIGAAVEAFSFAERHPRNPMSRVIHGAGHAIQAGFVTREPDEDELAVGRQAMEEILRIEQAEVEVMA
jgi:uncharacterized protein YqhQ